MEKKDGSDWFTSSPKPLENAVKLARNFLEPAIMQAIYEACCDILNERPTVDSMNEAVATAILHPDNIAGLEACGRPQLNGSIRRQPPRLLERT